MLEREQAPAAPDTDQGQIAAARGAVLPAALTSTRALARMDPLARAAAGRHLQRTIGNRALARLSEPTRCKCGGIIGADGQCDRCRALGRMGRVLARTVTYDDCSSAQQTTILAAHDRGKEMIKQAVVKLGRYDGTDPAVVKTALKRHFNSTSTWVARIVKDNLVQLLGHMKVRPDPQYECQSEDDDGVLAWVPWCVPFADIEVYPRWFTKTADERAGTLVHEWFHKYLCKLDVGYEHEEGYEDQSTLRHLTNADSYGEFVYDVTR